MKSPLKDKPLRNPGDSVQKAIDDYLIDHVMSYVLMAVVCIVIAWIDWYRHLNQIAIDPWLFTYVSIFFVLSALYKVLKGIPIVRNMKLGRDGERAVGQYLETLREVGAKVFHDVPGEGFNLDHVIIANAGVFLVETKTYSKPDKGEPTITFNGEAVTLKGRGTFQEPVVQVTAGARWLSELLKKSTGKDLPIRPVLVFPGWFVQPTVEARSSEVWVLNPKALPSFIANSRQMLSTEDVNLIAYHLSRYLRAS
jgi:hypothetical protein